jgi:nitrate/TMAO reductase-like tetraheme cytochrome c subunit
MSLTVKLIIASLLLLIIAGAGIGAYKFYDYTQNDPNFCISCHLMKPAFEAWQKSEHQKINCHNCHHLSIPEQNRLLINFILYRPQSVPPRHGKIIVPWKSCAACHIETSTEYPDAKKINNSPLHAKHFFMEQIECAKCHGYIVHKFIPEEKFCLKCHQGKDVHGAGMEGLACLNCHTDRTKDLRPERKKCLFCHGSEKIRKELIAEGTIDVKHYQPSPDVIEKATKINVPPDAPMQFYCYECHKPHTKVRPDWGDCLKCHSNTPSTGKHELHVKMIGMKCKECHKPHIWRVTEVQAKKDCTKCHEYREPKRFIGP